ncbi:Hypothetical protein Minf_1499 [Methylacidiphilum infernorum V4]|uniref:Uncharacterized protein n=1 Tax=Methylacidiphilum infernorum (isolate V4) TaxID=481448 RepID=B3DW50_METI4|nr:Hypothetical protein Minf_1499 [Methylacidiphilum infernorum V4]
MKKKGGKLIIITGASRSTFSRIIRGKKDEKFSKKKQE